MATNPLTTAFSQNATDPFYNFNQFQQNPDYDWTQTEPIGGAGGYLENNPQAAWTRYLQGNYGIGLTDTSPFSTFVRNQYQNAQRGFEAALAEDPTLIFQNYLSNINPNFQQMFSNLTPSQRGENVSRYAGPVRWISDI